MDISKSGAAQQNEEESKLETHGGDGSDGQDEASSMPAGNSAADDYQRFLEDRLQDAERDLSECIAQINRVRIMMQQVAGTRNIRETEISEKEQFDKFVLKPAVNSYVPAMDNSDSGAAQQKEEETHGVDCSDGKVQDGPSSTPAENSANNSILQGVALLSLADQTNDAAKEELESLLAGMKNIATDPKMSEFFEKLKFDKAMMRDIEEVAAYLMECANREQRD
ncbi:Hypothetical predicted protein [Cloeon dipterum]|uniref:Uncharacterized protein n=1 Tax=Cloeon dipterum TaxID=197152 RepID=A0A8S1DF79_9INSE|nr:Hypothetical predicted protein [Cloeon dipterum]